MRLNAVACRSCGPRIDNSRGGRLMCRRNGPSRITWTICRVRSSRTSSRHLEESCEESWKQVQRHSEDLSMGLGGFARIPMKDHKPQNRLSNKLKWSDWMLQSVEQRNRKVASSFLNIVLVSRPWWMNSFNYEPVDSNVRCNNVIALVFVDI